MSELHVCLDVSSVPKNPAGAGRYIVELARGLHSNGVKTTLITRRSDAARWEFGGVTTVLPVVPDRTALRLIYEQVSLGSLVNKLSPDVFHSPHYTTPNFIKIPQVVTIHDMFFFTNPEWHEKKKVQLFRHFIRKAAKNADGLVAVSNATSRQFERLFHRDPTVIPLGVDHDRFNTRKGEGDSKIVGWLNERAITGDFVLAIGTIEPRKNYRNLIRAFHIVNESLPNLDLVIAGGKGWSDEWLESVQVSLPNVKIVGFVPEDLIPALYRSAKCFVYPAFAEGFGLPVLEAAACGIPVVTTENSAMSEVLGNTAIYIDPYDENAIATAIIDVVESDTDVNSESLIQQAAKYTWSQMVACHIELYEEVSLNNK